MKLTIATAFIAASTSPSSISTSRVAASILEHENSKGSVPTAVKTQGVECAIVDSFVVQKSADVGLLSCSAGEVCVEDSTSTMGGRCKVLASAGDEAAALEPQRERELCEKCEGEYACGGHDLSKIGCGSCIGSSACMFLASDVTIGENSCVGVQACYEGGVSVGDNSCLGDYTCSFTSGDDIPSNACVGDDKCRFQNRDTAVVVGTPSPAAAATVTLSPFSSMPSESPTSMPSGSPSSQPSSMPSESPTLQPSSQPSETPSCNPSSAPTPSPSINLFYPDLSTDSQGCMSDGNQPAWMDANPTNWLSTTQEKCCQAHFGWNLPTCLGEHPTECAATLWYPDWEGSNKGCLRDGNEPLYMVQNKNVFIFSDKQSCCEEHFSWGFDVCMGDDTVTTVYSDGSGDKFYADWTSGTDTCKNDGLAPEYMVNAEAIWLYDDLDNCCERFFSYRLDLCKAGGNTPSYSGTNKWYTNWNDSTCYKDCVVGGTNCGGPADFFAANNLFDSKEECCSTTLSYDYKNCVRA